MISSCNVTVTARNNYWRKLKTSRKSIFRENFPCYCKSCAVFLLKRGSTWLLCLLLQPVESICSRFLARRRLYKGVYSKEHGYGQPCSLLYLYVTIRNFYSFVLVVVVRVVFRVVAFLAGFSVAASFPSAAFTSSSSLLIMLVRNKVISRLSCSISFD